VPVHMPASTKTKEIVGVTPAGCDTGPKSADGHVVAVPAVPEARSAEGKLESRQSRFPPCPMPTRDMLRDHHVALSRR
jgi:hypothetical protein